MSTAPDADAQLIALADALREHSAGPEIIGGVVAADGDPTLGTVAPGAVPVGSPAGAPMAIPSLALQP